MNGVSRDELLARTLDEMKRSVAFFFGAGWRLPSVGEQLVEMQAEAKAARGVPPLRRTVERLRGKRSCWC